MEELNHSEGKFDLRVIGDFNNCRTEINSFVIGDRISFEIEVKTGVAYAKECFISHNGKIVMSEYDPNTIGAGSTLVVNFNSKLITAG